MFSLALHCSIFNKKNKNLRSTFLSAVPLCSLWTIPAVVKRSYLNLFSGSCRVSKNFKITIVVSFLIL